MMQTIQNREKDKLLMLCKVVKEYIQNNKKEECEKYILNAMRDFPHSAIPHNLMGILLEQFQDKAEAMKHFRAAYALNPTYLPACYNMEKYASFNWKGETAFTEDDCIKEEKEQKEYEIQYNSYGVKSITKKGERKRWNYEEKRKMF